MLGLLICSISVHDVLVQVMVKLTRQYVHDHLPNMHSVQFGVPREAAELNFLKVLLVFSRCVVPARHGSHPSMYMTP